MRQYLLSGKPAHPRLRNLALIVALLGSGCASLPDSDGLRAAIIDAAGKGQKQRLAQLLDREISDRDRPDIAAAAMVAGARAGKTDIVHYLLPQAGGDGSKALTAAAGHGHTQVVHLLLSTREFSRPQLARAAFAAVDGKHGEIIRVLIASAGSVVGPGAPRDESLLIPAIMYPQQGFAGYLAEEYLGAPPLDKIRVLKLVAGYGDSKLLEALLYFGWPVDVTDEQGESALFGAVRAGNRDNVALLLQGWASPGITNQRGLTPMCLARQGGFDDVIRLLQEYDAADGQCTTPH